MANIEKRRIKRKEYQEKRKLLRQERRKKHLCIYCGKPVKPRLVYYQECEEHNYHNHKKKREENN